MFLEWSGKLWQVLEDVYPMPPGTTPIPEDELLPPRYLISIQKSKGPSEIKLTPPRASFPCTVKQNQRMTAKGHWQDVRHVILESKDSALDYEPGDIAVVWPENPKEEVDIFLDTLHWTEIADTPLTVTTSNTGTALRDISDWRQTSPNSINSTNSSDTSNHIFGYLLSSSSVLL
jgi:sulfite reductase alpha subunit-like flavoprotein